MADGQDRKTQATDILDEAMETARLSKKRSHKTLVIAGATVACVVLIALGFSVWFFMGGASDFYDSNAAQGSAPYKTPEEIQADLNRQVEEGMFEISIASVIDFPTPGSPGKAYIENVAGNRYDMIVRIVLDDTGEQVFESKGLAPGTYLEDITISSDLTPGAHRATAMFEAFDRETHKKVGQAAAKIQLTQGGG